MDKIFFFLNPCTLRLQVCWRQLKGEGWNLWLEEQEREVTSCPLKSCFRLDRREPVVRPEVIVCFIARTEDTCMSHAGAPNRCIML